MHAGQEASLCWECRQGLVHHSGCHVRLGLQVDLDKWPAALLCTPLLFCPVTNGNIGAVTAKALCNHVEAVGLPLVPSAVHRCKHSQSMSIGSRSTLRGHYAPHVGGVQSVFTHCLSNVPNTTALPLTPQTAHHKNSCLDNASCCSVMAKAWTTTTHGSHLILASCSIKNSLCQCRTALHCTAQHSIHGRATNRHILQAQWSSASNHKPR